MAESAEYPTLDIGSGHESQGGSIKLCAQHGVFLTFSLALSL